MHPADRIQAGIERTGSVLVVGLDPRPELVPPDLVQSALADGLSGADAVAKVFLGLNTQIIEMAAGSCAAVKPQLACYEAYGAAGWRCLEATIAACEAADIPVVADGKRNDIGSTAAHYGQAAFGGAVDLEGHLLPGLGVDWLTVNAYLGSDGITPFLDATPNAGLFVLVRTSNPSSVELQEVALAGNSEFGGERTVADHMAGLVRSWGEERVGASGLASVGAVVGATQPNAARALRLLMPNTPFLVPGYGAQGADADDAVAGARPDGSGILVNSSRGIMGAWRAQPERPWQDSIADAIGSANSALGAALARI